MNISQQERDQIYKEEAERRAQKHDTEGSITPVLVLVTVAAAVGLGALIMASRRGNRKVKLEDLRKAYAGLSPDDAI